MGNHQLSLLHTTKRKALTNKNKTTDVQRNREKGTKVQESQPASQLSGRFL